MRKSLIVVVFLAALLLQFPAQAQGCTLCVGLAGSDGSVVGAFTRLDELTYPSFAPVNPSNVSVLIEYEAGNVEEVERKTGQILEWARSHGPFDGLGVSLRNADATL